MRIPLCRLVLALGLVLASPLTSAEPRVDAVGDALPDAALARLGTARFRQNLYTYSIDLSPDGKLLAVSDTTGIRLLDSTTSQKVRDVNLGATGSPRTGKLLFSPDGKVLAVAPDSAGLLYV